MNLINFVTNHYIELGMIISLLFGVAEIIVRLTPTKTDDGALERIGKFINIVFDLLKVPNLKK